MQVEPSGKPGQDGQQNALLKAATAANPNLALADLRGPNRDAGPTPLEEVWVRLGEISEFLSTIRKTPAEQLTIDTIKSLVLSMRDFDNYEVKRIVDSANRCAGYLEQRGPSPYSGENATQMINVADAASRLRHVINGITGDSTHLLGFKREEIKQEDLKTLFEYVKFLGAVLENVGEPIKKNQANSPANSHMGADILKSLLSWGLVDGAFARFLNNMTVASCDGKKENLFFGKLPCVVWFDRDSTKNFAATIAESATTLYGQHSPLAVSLERPTEDLSYFVPTSELERRLTQSAIIILKPLVPFDTSLRSALHHRDPLLFFGLDYPPNVWMGGPIPASHIYKIVVPQCHRDELSRSLPTELHSKIAYTGEDHQISASEIDLSRRAETLKVPSFDQAIAYCLRQLEREALLENRSGPIKICANLIDRAKHFLGATSILGRLFEQLDRTILGTEKHPNLTIGIHATRLGQ